MSSQPGLIVIQAPPSPQPSQPTSAPAKAPAPSGNVFIITGDSLGKAQSQAHPRLAPPPPPPPQRSVYLLVPRHKKHDHASTFAVLAAIATTALGALALVHFRPKGGYFKSKRTETTAKTTAAKPGAHAKSEESPEHGKPAGSEPTQHHSAPPSETHSNENPPPHDDDWTDV